MTDTTTKTTVNMPASKQTETVSKSKSNDASANAVQTNTMPTNATQTKEASDKPLVASTQSDKKADDNSKKSQVKPDASNKSSKDEQPVTYKPVDIMVYGKVYTVNCPVGEEAGLKQAGKYVNNLVQKIRRQAPHLSQEELLVLCCLDMYESMQDLKDKENKKEDSEQKALNLVNKMLADTQTMLS